MSRCVLAVYFCCTFVPQALGQAVVEENRLRTQNRQAAEPQNPLRLPEVDWDVDWKVTRKRPGYPLIESAEHFSVLAPAVKHGAYHHHPQIVFFNDRFFASWSNHPTGEDGPGQRVIGATSIDGKSWKPLPTLFDRCDTVRNSTANGRLLMASPFIKVEDRLFAVAIVNDSVGYGAAETPIQGKPLSRTKTPQFFKRIRRARGFLLRELEKDLTFGKMFWLGDEPPPQIAGFEAFVPPSHIENTLVEKIHSELRDPVTQPMWDFDSGAAEVVVGRRRLTEPTTVRKDDGALIRYYRDLTGSQKLFARFSFDQGATWTEPKMTNIPDAPAKSFLGRLPDGQFYLIGNQVVSKRGTRRDPLTIGLSNNGTRFRRAFAIRWRTPKFRVESQQAEPDGRGRGFQYPSATVANDALWIIYSVNKEAIDVSRIRLETLKRGQKPN